MKNKKLKGSVLFTVIAVMMVVLVFVMSALTIAGATSKRAYSDYSKAQTQYTAHAALEATMKYLRDYDISTDKDGNTVEKNNALGTAVAELGTSSGTIELPVSFMEKDGEGNLSPDNAVATDGKATVKIKCINDSYIYTDGKEHSVVVVTASATLAGVTTEESMVLLKDPPKKDVPLGGPNSLTSMSGVTGSTNPFIIGGASANVLTEPIPEISVTNNSAFIGTTVINTNYNPINTDTKIKLATGEGFTVFGDFTLSGQIYFETNCTVAPTDYKEIPYLFVDGLLKQGGNFTKFSVSEVANGNMTPMNIYCKGIQVKSEQSSSGFNVKGDIYIFGGKDSAGNDIKTSLEYSNVSTHLLKWADSIINPASVGGTKCGGNFYCNSDLTLSAYNNSATFQFDKNLYAKNELSITGGANPGSCVVTVDGKLISAGSLKIDNAQVICSSLYIDDFSNVEITGENGSLTVGDVVYTNTSGGNAFYNQCCSKKAAGSPTGDIKWAKWNNCPELGGYGTLASELSYPKEFTRAELTGEPDATNSEPSKDNKIVETAVNENMLKYVSFQDSDGDGVADIVDGKKVPIYSEAYFKTEEDVKDIFASVATYDNSNIPHVSGNIDNSNYSTGKFVVPESEKIKQSCVIQGGLSNKKIVIDTGDDENGVLWVKLDNGLNEFSIDSDTSIIVTGKGVAKFYTSSSVKFWDRSGLYTDVYYKRVKLDKSLIVHKKPNESQKNDIPNIYFYMDYKNNDKTLCVGNGSMMTAYIFAPTSKFSCPGDGGPGVTTFNYYTEDGENIDVQKFVNKDPRIVIIGSAFVGDYDTQNDSAFVYINNSDSGDAGDPTEVKTTWAVLGYQNGNEFIY
ncbi:MAG: hypothetical protein ACI4JM_13645 [Oscillospiraceae bacterium]